MNINSSKLNMLNPVVSFAFLPILLDILVLAKKGIRILNIGGILQVWHHEYKKVLYY